MGQNQVVVRPSIVGSKTTYNVPDQFVNRSVNMVLSHQPTSVLPWPYDYHLYAAYGNLIGSASGKEYYTLLGTPTSGVLYFVTDSRFSSVGSPSPDNGPCSATVSIYFVPTGGEWNPLTLCWNNRPSIDDGWETFTFTHNASGVANYNERDVRVPFIYRPKGIVAGFFARVTTSGFDPSSIAYRFTAYLYGVFKNY